MHQQDEKINTATFTPNLGTVSCSRICLPSIKGQVHVLVFFFKKSLNYLLLFHWHSAFYSYLTRAAEKRTPEGVTLESGFIYLCAYSRLSQVISTTAPPGSASLIDFAVISNEWQRRRTTKQRSLFEDPLVLEGRAGSLH